MSKYTSTLKITVPFDGDEVEITLGRLTFADALAMRDAPDTQTTVLTKYVVAVTGLIDADGKNVSISAVLSEFYFAPLVIAIAKALMSTGGVPDEAVAPFVQS